LVKAPTLAVVHSQRIVIEVRGSNPGTDCFAQASILSRLIK
jgi:hypothetical protein